MCVRGACTDQHGLHAKSCQIKTMHIISWKILLTYINIFRKSVKSLKLCFSPFKDKILIPPLGRWILVECRPTNICKIIFSMHKSDRPEHRSYRGPMALDKRPLMGLKLKVLPELGSLDIIITNGAGYMEWPALINKGSCTVICDYQNTHVNDWKRWTPARAKVRLERYSYDAPYKIRKHVLLCLRHDIHLARWEYRYQ